MASDVIATAAVEIAPDLSRFGQRLGADIRGATRDATRAAADVGKQIGGSFDDAARRTDRLTRSLRSMAETAGGITLADVFNDIAGGAKDFLRSTTQAASGLEQSLGAVDSVFRSSAGTINDWGQTSAESFGLSQRAFNEAVTPVGALLKNLGFSLEETTGRTGELTERAADMAATFGGPTKDALDAIQAALRGETDPIERYGVLLNEATVNARALADTGKSSADALTLQEKAAARLNLIMEQTSQTQGQFAREADTVAGAQQRLNATWEDAQAALGDAFAPVVRIAADALTELLGVFQSLPGPVKFVVGTLAALVAAAVAIAPAITAAATALGAMGVSAAAVAAGTRTLLIALGPIALVVAGVAAAITTFSDDVKINQQVVDGLKESLTGLNTEAERVTATMRQLQQSGQADVLRQLGVSTEEAARAIANGGREFDNLIAKIEALKEQAGDAGDQTLDLIVAALREQRDAATGAAVATDELNRANQGAAQSARAAAEAAREQTNAVLAARDAQRGLQAAIDGATAAITENGRTLDVATEAGRANQAALDGIITSTLGAVDADRKKGVSGTQLLSTLLAGRDAFLAAAQAAGVEAGEARRLADQLGLIPRNVLTVVELRSATAEAAAIRLRDLIASIPANKLINLRVNTTGAPGGHFFAGLAGGGIARAGEWTVVGEEGPELVRWGSTAQVFSNPESRRIADDVGELDRMTARGDLRGTGTTTATTPAPVALTNNVDVQPAVHVYLGDREISGLIERVVVDRERYTSRLIKSSAGVR